MLSPIEEDGLPKPIAPGTVEKKSRLTEIFPWLAQFKKLCVVEMPTNIGMLENLMALYLHNISPCVKECYLKPRRAAKLRKSMNDTLLFFHFLYSDFKKPLQHSSYLDKMSDLMAMYMDMEIKASRRGKESLPKIASRLTSSLYIFLDHGQDYILDSILKSKCMNKNSWELCVLIFRCVLRESPGRGGVYEMTYARYILAFKMWKSIVRGAEERRRVMKLATMKLFPPTQFREKLKAGILKGVLPKIPKSRKDITMFFMQAKFRIREKKEAFLKAVADPEQHVQLSAHLDRQLFFEDGMDGSKIDGQDLGGNLLMNDIKSKISLESGMKDCLRLSSIVTPKSGKGKNKSQKNIVRCKGIATPFFKTELIDTEANGSEVCQKKKKKQKDGSSDNVDVKNCETVIDKKPDITLFNVVENQMPPVVPAIGNLEDPKLVGLKLDGIKLEIPVGNIKVEPITDGVPRIGYFNVKGEVQVNQVDSVCQGDKEDEMLEVAGEVVIQCNSENPSVPESSSESDLPYSNPVNDFISDYLVNSKLSDFDLDSGGNEMEQRDIYEMFDINKSLNIKSKENLFHMCGDNVLNEMSSIAMGEEVSDSNRNKFFLLNSGNSSDKKDCFTRSQVLSVGFGYPTDASHLDDSHLGDGHLGDYENDEDINGQISCPPLKKLRYECDKKEILEPSEPCPPINISLVEERKGSGKQPKGKRQTVDNSPPNTPSFSIVNLDDVVFESNPTQVENNKTKFKTAAQPKKGSSRKRAPKTNADHDIANFAKNEFCTSQPTFSDSKPVTRSRHKSKLDRSHSRKMW